jgi:hypothetical protein
MSMQKKAKADDRLCLSYCRYYKPGRNEELKCQGYVVVHEIMRKRCNLALNQSVRATTPDRATQERLTERVCSNCAFAENDCDYLLTGGSAVPCGGFVFLIHLLGTGALTFEEIEDAC